MDTQDSIPLLEVTPVFMPGGELLLTESDPTVASGSSFWELGDSEGITPLGSGQGEAEDRAIASGDVLTGEPVTVYPDQQNLNQTANLQGWTLDVDGDGAATALSDGIIIVRYLFGSVFAGDALTAGAISPDATRTTDEIRAYLQQGVDQKFLDIDGDSTAEALSDGIMIVRYLFGAVFAGDALTTGAISSDATRTTAEIRTYLEDIDNNTSDIDLVGTSFNNDNALLKAGSFYSYLFNYRIDNQGTTNAGNFDIGFYLSKDNAITTNDVFLGNASINSLAAGGNIIGTQSITLPSADDTFWNGQGTYYIGMIVDYQDQVVEANENNNTQYDVSLISSFNIELDYTYDTSNWFDTDKKATLEAAANIWETIILDEFTNIPTGTPTPYVRNPQTNEYLGTNFIYTTASPIDDVKIFLGASALGVSELAKAGSSGYYSNEVRYTGNDFQPWLGSLTFNNTKNWFVDGIMSNPTIPSNQHDLLSVAVHEIGHVLGFSDGLNAFSRWISNGTFTGTNAKMYNGGNPVPMEPVYTSVGTRYSHIKDQYQYSNYGENAMDPTIVAGKRKLLTLLDLAMFDDIGYDINYDAAYYNG